MRSRPTPSRRDDDGTRGDNGAHTGAGQEGSGYTFTVQGSRRDGLQGQHLVFLAQGRQVEGGRGDEGALPEEVDAEEEDDDPNHAASISAQRPFVNIAPTLNGVRTASINRCAAGQPCCALACPPSVR